MIAQSQLFDPVWYLERYPDVAEGPLEPLEHFVLYGAKDFRDPSPFFHARDYAAKHAGEPGAAASPLLHYIENGGSRDARLREIRDTIENSRLFDPAWYLERYPDVAEGPLEPLEHFVLHGAKDFRDPSPLFHSRCYAAKHAGDADAAANPLLHYIENGGSRDARLREIRDTIEKSRLFDPAWYLERYPDVAEGPLEPLEHFVLHGAKDFRDPSPLFHSRCYAAKHAGDADAAANPLLHYIEGGGSRDACLQEIRATIEKSELFDPIWYLERYPDVAGGRMDPLEHFVLHGGKGLRDPSLLFHARDYAAKHAGEPEAVANPLLHYIENGGSRNARLREIRDTIEKSELFDPNWYLERYPDVAGGHMDPLEHFVLHGGKELRDPSLWFHARDYAAKHAGEPEAAANPLLHYIENGGSRDARLREIRNTIEQSQLFDPVWYLENYPDAASEDLDPLGHYIRVGAGELRDPNRRFSARRYAASNVADPYARANPLLHFIERGGPSPNNAVAIKFLSGVAHLDPDLANLERSVLTLPFSNRLPRNDSVSEAWKRLFATLDRPFDRIIFVPSPRLGEADRAAAHAANALVALYGADSFLVVVTDGSGAGAADGFVDGSQIRDLSECDRNLSLSDRVELISWLIRALKPKSVLNVNSEACWELFKYKGAAISTFCELYAAVSFGDCDKGYGGIGFVNGYLRNALRHLKQVYADNEHIVGELRSKFAIPPTLLDRFKVINPTCPETTALAYEEPPVGRRFPVLTVGRLCERANVEFLVELAKLDQNLYYEFYGLGKPAYLKTLTEAACSNENFAVKGSCANNNDLPAGKFGAFLYVASCCGSPDALFAAAKAGLPIIASDVGGIGELVDEDTGWLIEDARNPAAYLEALREIRNNPEKVRKRLLKMRERLDLRHTWTFYLNECSVKPSFLS
ncbi:glycosyltransferase [Rhodoblastus acidophilus]|nr:glycosyltransferase [Candidatus Rhodoblastus alkanivorans]MDI4641122.1 glycosyltransferase [Rhodoblastus acidophilus]